MEELGHFDLGSQVILGLPQGLEVVAEEGARLFVGDPIARKGQVVGWSFAGKEDRRRGKETKAPRLRGATTLKRKRPRAAKEGLAPRTLTRRGSVAQELKPCEERWRRARWRLHRSFRMCAQKIAPPLPAAPSSRAKRCRDLYGAHN